MCREHPGTCVILHICRPVPPKSIIEEQERTENINITFITPLYNAN